MSRTYALLLLPLALAACPADDGGGGDGDGGSTSATTTAPGTTDGGPGGTTSPGATSMPMGDSTGAAGSSTGTPAGSSDGGSTGGPACSGDLDLGAACTDPCDCMTGACFVVGPLGGVCSECDEDADCTDPNSGCNFGNPLTGVAATCSDGSIGSGCETADACQAGLFCPTLIDVPGLLQAATCSECESDADCAGQQCAPTYDIANIGGFYQCVDAGTVPNDEGCDLLGDGSECTSGQCAPAGLMGIPILGICSPCNEDADCMGGQTCQLPELAIVGMGLELLPGMCV